MPYRSPFITETDKPAFTDCQFAAGLMLLAEWTAGEAIHDRHGNNLDGYAVSKGLSGHQDRLSLLILQCYAFFFTVTAEVDNLRLMLQQFLLKILNPDCGSKLNGKLTAVFSPLQSVLNLSEFLVKAQAAGIFWVSREKKNLLRYFFQITHLFSIRCRLRLYEQLPAD